MFAEIFDAVAEPVGGMFTRGALLRDWRVLAIDGFDVDLPDSAENGAEFGYAGSGDNRSAYPKARVVALSECGTHAFLAAEVASYGVGEKTLAKPLYGRLQPDELLTADRNFYSYDAWGQASTTGAALVWRAPTQLELPLVEVLPDGTYATVLVNPKLRGARRDRVLAAAKAGDDLDPTDGHLVRVIEYTVPDRDGNGTGELIVLLTTIPDPRDAQRRRAGRHLPPALGARNRQRPAQDPPTRPRQGAALPPARPGPPGDMGLAHRPLRHRVLIAHAAEAADIDPDRISFTRRPAHHPPYRHRDGGHSP